MVREEQSVRRDEFACTAVSELNDSVFNAWLVEVENLFCCEFTTELLHLIKTLIA